LRTNGTVVPLWGREQTRLRSEALCFSLGYEKPLLASCLRYCSTEERSPVLAKAIVRATFAVLTAGWLLLASPWAAQAQLSSRAAGVALVARMPETAGVQWAELPASEFQQQGTWGNLIVVRGDYHLATGETVYAEARVEGRASDGAELVVVYSTARGADELAAYGFLSHRPLTKVSLLAELDPRTGKKEQIDALLVGGTENSRGEKPLLRITVTAF
jgi:hypothetical protein